MTITESVPTTQRDASDATSAPAPGGSRRWLPGWVGPVATVLAVAGFCVWMVEDVLEPLMVPKNFGQVEPGLYRAGFISEQLVGPTLHQNDIDVIVALTAPEPQDPRYGAYARAARRLGIERYHYPLAGNGTGDPLAYSGAVAKLAEAREGGKSVLVHCAAGAERTSGTVSLYRVLFQNADPAAEVEAMMHYKHDPERNPDLIPYLNQNMATIVDDLVARGTLHERPDPLPQFPVPQ